MVFTINNVISVDSKKKSILLISEFPPPPGGIAQQAELLLTFLSKDGISVRRCKTNFNLPWPLNLYEKSIIIKILIKFPVLMFRIFRGIAGCRVVHVLSCSHLSFFVITTPAIIISKLLLKRVILNCHGGDFENFYKKWHTIVAPILNLADCITVPSPFLRDLFNSFGYKVKIIPNIANLEKFHFRKGNQYKPNFIVTRHLEQVYGIDIVLKAFSLIMENYPHAQLTVVGGGSLERQMKELARQLGILRNVMFTGYVENDKLPELYNKSDIFLNASRLDNMPISLLEAFASGLPVITTRAGGIPYIITDNENGLLVKVDDEFRLAEKAKELIANPGKGNYLVNNAKEYVESLSWENIRSKLLKEYNIGA